MSFLLKENDISQNINNASSIEELESIRVKLLGKKGLVTQEMKFLSSLSINEKKVKGMALNKVKEFIKNEIFKKRIYL